MVLKKRVAIVSNTSWNLYNFRRNLAKSLEVAGYEVIMIAPRDSYSDLLEQDFVYEDVKIDNDGTNPIQDLKTVVSFYGVYKKLRPDIVLSYTIKPNIYGTIAANLLNIKVIKNISGLGTVFIKKSLATKVAKLLYKFSNQRASKVFFQNQDDGDLFVKKHLVDKDKVHILPGSGVDTENFLPVKYEKKDKIFRFLLIARILKDKGIFEYVDAAREMKKKYKNIEFQLLGSLDVANVTAISKEAVDRWISDDLINYLGATDDVRNYISQVDCIVLPSYREGTPRTLLESASMQKPIVTTDTVGCKDVVDDGKTGFLCKVKDSKDLEDKMIKMMNLTDNDRSKMGKLGREKMLEKYDEKIVIQKYINSIEKILTTKLENSKAE
jgi:glycosyltransferase involved in cell wall biosynthesis